MLPNEVVEAVRQQIGLNEDDTSWDDEIQQMPLDLLLYKYLTWEGIHGYSPVIALIARHYGATTKPKEVENVPG